MPDVVSALPFITSGVRQSDENENVEYMVLSKISYSYSCSETNAERKRAAISSRSKK